MISTCIRSLWKETHTHTISPPWCSPSLLYSLLISSHLTRGIKSLISTTRLYFLSVESLQWSVFYNGQALITLEKVCLNKRGFKSHSAVWLGNLQCHQDYERRPRMKNHLTFTYICSGTLVNDSTQWWSSRWVKFPVKSSLFTLFLLSFWLKHVRQDVYILHSCITLAGT